MPFSAPAIEDGVAESPRLYASAFRSSVDRFKGPHAEKVQVTNLEYDIDLFETAAGVEKSRRKLAAIFRAPAKSERNTAIWRFEKVDDPVYDIDGGKHATLFTATQERKGWRGPAQKYSFNLSSPRFRVPRSMGPKTEVYDTDVLDKAALATAAAQSPRLYSEMRTTTGRSEVQSKVAEADYYPTNHELRRAVLESNLKYSAMTSRTPRAAPERPINGAEYDTDVLGQMTVGKSAELLPGHRSAFVATPRQPPGNRSDGPDKMYDPDCGVATSVWTAVQNSPRAYSNVRLSGRRETERPPLGLQLDYDADTPVRPATIATGVLASPVVYGNMRTRTPRFVTPALPPQHGAVYDSESAPRGEGSVAKRVMESPRRYFGAQSVAKRSLEEAPCTLHLQYDVDYAQCETLATGVKRTPRQYRNVRSQVPRFKTEKKEAPMDEYEALLRNPDKIDLKFQIRGSVVVKQTTDRALLVVGRQGPPQA